MRKRAISLLLILLLVLSIASISVSARYSGGSPVLTFSGTTANCTATVTAANSSDTVQATLTLRENGTLVAGWNGSGTGSVTLSKPYAATSGASYTLTLNCSINGVSQPSVSISATCP